MAFTVKSRRAASSSKLPNTLSRKIRPLSFTCASPSLSWWPRKVDTSIVSLPHMTCTRRNLRPIMRERRKTLYTSSGVASVAISKSFGLKPNIKSRTAPPTIYALKPAFCKPSQVFSAAWLISFLSILCDFALIIFAEFGVPSSARLMAIAAFSFFLNTFCRNFLIMVRL